MTSPLAERLRPTVLDDVVGQSHILGKGKVLRKMIENGFLPNLIFYGPSGVGKTTVARILSQTAGKKLYHLNGTTASAGDFKAIVGDLDTFEGRNGVVLYLDEIQYLNKKQQQTLLEFIEDGRITLIASTTENPYFYVYNAILSRSTVFEFEPIRAEEIQIAVKRAFAFLGRENDMPYLLEDGVAEQISSACGGDVRRAVNTVEIVWFAAGQTIADGDARHILQSDVEQVLRRSNMRYDRDGTEHYNILSALQKSIRGSDENAALHYLACLLEAGDLLSACRRLLVTASEDVGLAYPQAAAIVKACVDSAMQLGLPEAMHPLAEAVVLLSTAPKSNASSQAMETALSDVRTKDCGSVPMHLRDGHYAGAAKLGHAVAYQYPHSFPNHYVRQQYLPDALKDRVYYHFGENRTEQAAKAYREKICGEAAQAKRSKM